MEIKQDKNVNSQEAVKDRGIFNIPHILVLLVLIATFTFSGLYMAQDFFMMLPFQAGFSGYFSGPLLNGFWLYLIFGVVSWLMFELLVRIYFNYIGSHVKSIDKRRMIHILRYYFILRNILYGAVAILYYSYPLMIMLAETVIKPLITFGCCALFFVYLRRYIPKHQQGKSLAAMAMPLLGIYAALAVINIFLTVPV